MEGLTSWLNPLDFFIVFALLVGVALGFIRGLVRTTISLVVLYIAIVVAMSFYEWLGRIVGYITSGALPVEVSQAIAFMLILVLMTTLANFVISKTYKETELPGIRQIDQLGGMIVGFVLTCTWIGLAILALAFVLQATGTTGSSLRANILHFFNTSNLIPIFYQFLPIVMTALRPWMPQGLPPDIFSFRF